MRSFFSSHVRINYSTMKYTRRCCFIEYSLTHSLTHSIINRRKCMCPIEKWEAKEKISFSISLSLSLFSAIFVFFLSSSKTRNTTSIILVHHSRAQINHISFSFSFRERAKQIIIKMMIYKRNIIGKKNALFSHVILD